MKFTFDVLGVGNDPEPREQLEGIKRYLKEWGDYSPDSVADVIQCVLSLYDRFDKLEATIKKLNDDFDLIRGYREKKKTETIKPGGCDKPERRGRPKKENQITTD